MLKVNRWQMVKLSELVMASPPDIEARTIAASLAIMARNRGLPELEARLREYAGATRVEREVAI